MGVATLYSIDTATTAESAVEILNANKGVKGLGN